MIISRLNLMIIHFVRW